MTLKEKKRKLSEILGINLFDNKYKEIDKIIDEDGKVADSTEQVEKKATEASPEIEQHETDGKEDKPSEQAEEDNVDESTDEKDDDAEDSVDDADGEMEADSEETDDLTEEVTTDDTPSEGESVSPQDELFDAKLEAKLLRAGIREERLDAAKKLFKADYTIAEIEMVEKWVKEYPEWTKTKSKELVKGFGMDVGEHEAGETPEERRMRELGITK